MATGIRWGDKEGGGATETQASEAKGPFPRGKEVGSWGIKEIKRKSKSKIKSKIKSKNKKAHRPKSTGFNETNKHMELISKQQGRQ